MQDSAGANSLIPCAPVVEVDLFSGRPNPRWPSTEEEAAMIGRVLSSLPRTPGWTESLDSVLGYRGFVLTCEAERFMARVKNTTVQIRWQGREYQAVDAGRSVERILLELAQAHLDGDTMTLLLGETG